jgi:hypothetical protein
MSEGITTLRASAVDHNDVNQEVEKLWPQLIESGEVQREATKVGLDPRKFSPGEMPFVARRSEGQFGIAETLEIAAATGATTEAGKVALRVLWDNLIWPRLRRHFGDQLEPVS